MKADYIPEVKHLKVTFDDGTSETYHNVGPVAANSLIHSENMGAHFQKYIKDIYMTITRVERNRNGG